MIVKPAYICVFKCFLMTNFFMKFFWQVSQLKQVLCDFPHGKYILGRALSDVWKKFQDKMLHKKSRIRETPNLLTDANRSTDTEKTYKDFSSSLGDLIKQGWAAVHSTAEPWSTFLSIELHCISFLCSAHHRKCI